MKVFGAKVLVWAALLAPDQSCSGHRLLRSSPVSPAGADTDSERSALLAAHRNQYRNLFQSWKANKETVEPAFQYKHSAETCVITQDEALGHIPSSYSLTMFGVDPQTSILSTVDASYDGIISTNLLVKVFDIFFNDHAPTVDVSFQSDSDDDSLQSSSFMLLKASQLRSSANSSYVYTIEIPSNSSLRTTLDDRGGEASFKECNFVIHRPPYSQQWGGKARRLQQKESGGLRRLTEGEAKEAAKTKLNKLDLAVKKFKGTADTTTLKPDAVRIQKKFQDVVNKAVAESKKEGVDPHEAIKVAAENVIEIIGTIQGCLDGECTGVDAYEAIYDITNAIGSIIAVFCPAIGPVMEIYGALGGIFGLFGSEEAAREIKELPGLDEAGVEAAVKRAIVAFDVGTNIDDMLAMRSFLKGAQSQSVRFIEVLETVANLPECEGHACEKNKEERVLDPSITEMLTADEKRQAIDTQIDFWFSISYVPKWGGIQEDMRSFAGDYNTIYSKKKGVEVRVQEQSFWNGPESARKNAPQ